MDVLADSIHLSKRFFGSIVPVGPRPTDVGWAEQYLQPGEAAIWRVMPRADRRHSIAVARRVEESLGVAATRPVLAAAMLHDVGKMSSGFGTAGRVGATVIVSIVGRPTAASWSGRGGMRGRVGRYARHPELGAAMLREAGSDPLTATWAREHHLPDSECTLPAEIARALREADEN
jgi:hypothetical protein